MKLKVLPIVTVVSLMLFSCETKHPEMKISIFCDHIGAIARQQNISFEDAAAKVREIGYSGVDIWIGQDAEQIKVLRKLGFTIPCAVANIDFFEGLQSEEVKAAEDFMVSNKIDKVLLVPGLKREGCDSNIVASIASFVSDAAGLGFKVLIEDFDNYASPTCGMSGVADMLAAVPGLGLNFDAGNFLFCGEDCIRALQRFGSKVCHVHLKDRVSETDMTSPAVGTGCIPFYYIICSLKEKGYDGWYTVEFFGSKDYLADAKTSFETVKDALSVEEMTAGMTEYYYPKVPRVDPIETDTAAPDDAVILFDGKDLSKWCGDDGQDAAWTLNQDGTMTVDKSFGGIQTRESFGGTYLLHIEWCVPEDIEGENQSRGNSGVFLNGIYEVQILDCFENETYVDGQVASIYKQSVPSANPIRRPGEWNIYDITFTSPVVNPDGSAQVRPRITVIFNGVKVQDDFEIQGTTDYIGLPGQTWNETGPIYLQSHGDPSQPISFRNIWLKQL